MICSGALAAQVPCIDKTVSTAGGEPGNASHEEDYKEDYKEDGKVPWTARLFGCKRQPNNKKSDATQRGYIPAHPCTLIKHERDARHA